MKSSPPFALSGANEMSAIERERAECKRARSYPSTGSGRTDWKDIVENLVSL